MMKQKTTLFISTLLLLGLVSAPAQSSDSSLRFIGYGNAFEDLKMESGAGGESVDIQIYRDRLSRRYQIPSGSHVELYREEMVQDEDGRERIVRVPMAKIKKPSSESNLLVFIARSQRMDSPLPLSGFAVDDSYENYPAETIRMFNLSPYQVAVQIDGITKEIPRGSFEVFDYPAGNRICTLQFAYADEAGWNEAFKTRRPSRSYLRAVAFISETDEGPYPITVSVLNDRVPDPEDG